MFFKIHFIWFCDSEVWNFKPTLSLYNHFSSMTTTRSQTIKAAVLEVEEKVSSTDNDLF